MWKQFLNLDGLAENISIHTTIIHIHQTISVPPTCYIDTDYSQLFPSFMNKQFHKQAVSRLCNTQDTGKKYEINI